MTRGERGSGSVLGVAVIGATVLACVTVLPAVGAVAALQNTQNAADAAALAAADTLSGRSSGYPCENAGRAAQLDGAAVTSCATHDLIAAVSVERDWARLHLTARARAGPPGSR
jgi:secretion/DNA translocation related TadE-like protein